MEEKKTLLSYKPGTILQGVYKSYGRFGFLITDDDHEDVYISDRDHLNAVNNDTVEVKTMKSETGRHNTEGRVMKVLERANDTFVCTYEMLKDGGEAVPIDEKVDMYIEIPEGQEMDATTGARVIVEVTRWPGEWTDAEGRVTEVIGYKGDKGLDIDIIVAQHRLPHEFSEKVLDEAENLPRDIRMEKGLTDFRALPIVTIDGPDSKDLDDAVYCEKKANGHFELSVHIADVSRYVTKGSLLDDEAYRRGTSVYLADRVIPMLPFQLSNDLCSLNHDEDRYAMSCVMDVSPDGKVKTELVTPSIVRVARRCNYPEINKAFHEGIMPEDLSHFMPMLQDLKECADALRTDRTRRGALDFDFPEYKVILDEEGTPLRIEKRIRSDAEKMIEDAMIAANEAVARFLEKTGHTSIYRVHEHPDEEKLNSLKRLIAIMGLDLSIPKDPEPKDIQKLLETVKGEDIEAVVQVMTLRSLPQACYSTENAGHFGIASECYTHFTSPIRRYPDLMVHRLIRQAISDGLSKAELKKQTEFLLRAADHCSETEQNATDTERDVDDLKMTEYMVPFVGEPFDAHVTGITRFGVFVGLDNGVEGLVHIDSMDDDEYIYQEDTMTLKGRFSGTTYSMGMPVRVTLVKADKERREVDFIMGEIHSPLNLEKKTR
ncbi:MAG: ribonuclease R, partial [Dialister sp.]|nr:ribonuclease R [Dialister sp.]MDY2622567.1 ribonuclease R [Dialister sp.]